MARATQTTVSGSSGSTPQLPPVADSTRDDSTEIRSQRLAALDRIVNNPAFGFVNTVPGQIGRGEVRWTLNMGDCRAEVVSGRDGLRYRFQTRGTNNEWSPWEPPGNDQFARLPTSEMVIPADRDGHRNPVQVQIAHVHNLMFRLGRATRYDQDLAGIRREIAEIDALAVRHARIGNSGDPARDLLTGVYGATVVGPPRPGQPEPYGPGVLQVTLGSGPAAKTLLLRRQMDGQPATGFGLWQAALVPAPGQQPLWRLITPRGEGAAWMTPLGLTNDDVATGVLRTLPRFNYSTPFSYLEQTNAPRTAHFHPFTQPVRELGLSQDDRRARSRSQGELLLRTSINRFAPEGTEILDAASFTTPTNGPANVRINSTTKLWEVRYGSGEWIVCGTPQSFPTGTVTQAPAQRGIVRATRLIFLLGELNRASSSSGEPTLPPRP